MDVPNVVTCYNICHLNIYFHKVPVTTRGKMTADYQMARLILHALRWDSGMYLIRISHIVRNPLQQHQNQHLHSRPAKLKFVKFWWASKNLLNKYKRNTSINSWASLWLPTFFWLFCTLRVFKECHKVISPHPFYEGCKFDVCRTNSTVGCSSMEAYALMCAEASVCIPWRNATKGQCGRRVQFSRKLACYFRCLYYLF